MNLTRRGLLKTGAALGLGGAALAATVGAPRAAWDADEALLGDEVSLFVERGEAPVGSALAVRFFAERDADRAALFTWSGRMDEGRVVVPVLVEHPFPELRDAVLSFHAEVRIAGRPVKGPAPLRVPVRRYRFGC